MRQFILFICLAFGSVSSFAQHLCENRYILFCGSSESQVSKNSLVNCSRISVVKSDQDVISFFVSWKLNASTLIEERIRGNEFNERTIQGLLKLSAGTKVYIEKVTLSDGEEVGCKILELTE